MHDKPVIRPRRRDALALLLASGANLWATGFGLGAEQSARPTAAPSDPAVTDRTAPPLKDVFKSHFAIGMAGDLPGNYAERELALVREQFNAATPENCMKPSLVHPSENQWRFVRTDAFVNWCEENKIAFIHGHTLLWHHQTGDWVFQGDDKAVVVQRMKSHIDGLVGRYKGKIHSWDVVNEAIDDRGDARTAETENLRKTGWWRAVGPEYLTLAFQFAHQADPAAQLYYNDYGIEAGPKHASSMVLLRRLLKEKAPVYGVGIQGHWSTRGIPYDALDRLPIMPRWG